MFSSLGALQTLQAPSALKPQTLNPIRLEGLSHAYSGVLQGIPNSQKPRPKPLSPEMLKSLKVRSKLPKLFLAPRLAMLGSFWVCHCQALVRFIDPKGPTNSFEYTLGAQISTKSLLYWQLDPLGAAEATIMSQVFGNMSSRRVVTTSPVKRAGGLSDSLLG